MRRISQLKKNDGTITQKKKEGRKREGYPLREQPWDSYIGKRARRKIKRTSNKMKGKKTEIFKK